MSTMLLSIKPQYAKVILEGKKQYEFRKNKPKQNVTHIIFYASSPQKEVVGEAEIESILEGTPNEIWEIAKTAAGITKKFFFSYYQGKNKAFAYKLKNVKVYNEPKSLSDYGLKQAPQSYVYINTANQKNI
ncbi:MAG: ASCH domain-containing protein [Oscillospiraceae bacterium]|nr:ASCH domain-containing protein [Oscillospiraceae bacterium]